MMDAVNAIVLLFILIALVCHVARYWIGKYRQELATVYRYKLFAIRDKMMRAVAEGTIDPDDQSFQFLYKTINEILPRCRPLALSELLAVFRRRVVGKDPEWRHGFYAAIHHQSEEIKGAALSLLETVLDILIVKSLAMRLGLINLVTLLNKIGPKRIGKRLVKYADAHNLYKELDHMRRAAA